MDEMGIRGKTIGVAPVGCSVFAYNYFDCDFVEAAHGRAPAMATGIKRVFPTALSSPTRAMVIWPPLAWRNHARSHSRGEYHCFFINNAIYGMTGGQMAPTTLPGQKTSSSPNGRDVEQMGFPCAWQKPWLRLEGAGYVVRRSLHDPKNIRLAKKAIRTAFEAQNAGWASRWLSCFQPAEPTGV
jgi:2-oxoglutarate/2-oxoacid ferredoxin oxidoreductase subunit beta